MSNENEYILGTDVDERSRLAIQHRIWSDVAVAAWKKAGVGEGSRVLDLGCGPGHATFDVAQLVSEKGAVVGADASQRFVNYLNEQAKLRHVPQVSAQVVDAENLQATLAPQIFDVVYTRWLLCWLKNPAKAIAGVHHSLKSGGRFVIHDYFNWKTFSSGPRSQAIDKMVSAALKSFEAGGGDIDIGARLPKLLREAGFTLEHLDTHLRVARGGTNDGTIAWPLTWWRTYAPKLVQMGYLTSEECAAALRDTEEVALSAEKFFVCPPLFEFIAVKN